MKVSDRPVIFFRNDDVRERLDYTLISLTELFLKQQIPLAHAVEPANITPEVVNWLKSLKTDYPRLIDIVQHGYNHNAENPGIKMEFGGSRNYADQYNDILKGKDLMYEYFSEHWSPVFTFPYGTYNSGSLRALSDCGFKILSSKIKFTTKARLKNFLGRSLGKDFIFGKSVNYHPGVRSNYNFREISVSVNLIRKYTGYETADHYNLQEILYQIEAARKHTSIIGILMHHRFHGNHLEMIQELLTHLRNTGYSFVSFSELMY